MSSCSVVFSPARSRDVQVERRDQPLFGDRQRGDAGLVRTLERDECGCGTGGAAGSGDEQPASAAPAPTATPVPSAPVTKPRREIPSCVAPVGQLSFRAPAICDRFSESPASWAFSASATCGVTVTAGQRGDGNSLFSGQKLHPAVALAQRPHGVEQLGEPGGDLAEQLSVGVLQRSAQLVDGDLRTLQIGVEVPQVGLGVAILLAGQLALRTPLR